MTELFEVYHQPRFLSSDPLEFVHRFQDPWDQEAVAILSALLAYGNVKQIRRSVEEALERMKPSPAEFVRSLAQEAGIQKAERAFGDFVHRFNLGSDLVVLFRLIEKSWQIYSSVGAHFLSKMRPGASHIGEALSEFISEWNQWAGKLAPQRKKSFQYLLTSPADGSCCKRWCMLLRWMGRKDEMDPGLWTRGGALATTFASGKYLDPKQLIIPLDTHTGRISQYLGLTSRKSLNWLAAVEVTESLKTVDAEDPVRFDFAIARLGILNLCQKTYRRNICENCQLLPACRFAQGGLRA